MDLINPSAFSLMFLPLLFIIFYILQGGKEEKKVESLLFWQQVEENSNSFNVKFKFNTDMLFWLQLIVILLLIFSLLQPVITGKREITERAIIVIDRSASMKTEDISRNRFSEAVRRAIDKVNNLSSRTEIALLTADSSPAIITSFTADKRLIKDKLQELEVSSLSLDMNKTVNLINSFKESDDKVFFFTDRAFSYKGALPESTELLTVGDNVANMAISNFSVRKKSGFPGQYNLFLELANFSDKTEEIELEIKRGRMLIIKDRVKVVANEKINKEYNLHINEAVNFEINIKNDDYLQLDNSVRFHLGDDLQENFEVLYIGKDNYFLERAFLVIPGINLIKVKDNPDINLEELKPGDYDLYIFNEKAVPVNFTANILSINPITNNKDLSDKNKLRDTSNNNSIEENETTNKRNNEEVLEIMNWEKENPLFRFVNLQGLQLKGAKYEYLREKGRAIAWTVKGPIISIESSQLYRRVNIGFSLDQSNFSLQTGFPIFLNNIINWLRPDFQTPAYSLINTGDEYRYYPPAGEEIKNVISPKGEELDFTKIADSYLIQETESKGIYSIIMKNDKKDYFSANLLSERESKLNDRYDITSIEDKSNNSTVKSTLENDSTEAKDFIDKTTVKRKVILQRLWPYILLLAIIILLLEWYLYQRRYGDNRSRTEMRDNND